MAENLISLSPQAAFRKPLDKSLPKHSRLVVWSSINSAKLLVDIIGVKYPLAAEGSFMALAFLYTAWNPYATELFRFLLIAVFIGGIVRTGAHFHYPLYPSHVAIILLELIPTPIMRWMYSELQGSGAI